MLQGEFTQPGDDVAHAALPRILQWTAAEGSEAGAEYQSGVDEVGVGHHPLAQRCNRLVRQRQQQAIRKIGGRWGALPPIAYGLAVIPGV